MKLREIADLFTIKQTRGNMDVEITGLQMDSRKIEKGNLFVCVPGIKGFLEDRHLFAEDALQNGAAALIVERELGFDVPTIVVEDARRAMAVIASHFYDYPSHEMKVIGITGTNGKTTTSYLTEKIFADYQYKTGLMGNNGVKINHTWHPTDINTHEPPSLQQNLRSMRDCQTDYCLMEVTSQGIDLGRVLGCHFRTAVLTNLTQDHLDYHGTFEEYRNTKGLLFSRLGNTFHPEKKQYAVLNADDPEVDYFRHGTTAEVITYGINNEADVSAKDISMTAQGIRFSLVSFQGEMEIDLQLVGRFNLYNALAGITTALIEGIPLESIRKSLAELSGVDGRMEIVDEGQNFLVLVDYAHTPDGLENALGALKEFSKGKIITVFGCGGDRDIMKRPIMGDIAGKYSQFVYITSDNPRSEDPFKIMREIEAGLQATCSTEYEVVVDREEAIHKAIQHAEAEDIVLIAGKGHETYQLVKEGKIHFDDKEVARKAISNKLKGGGSHENKKPY